MVKCRQLVLFLSSCYWSKFLEDALLAMVHRNVDVVFLMQVFRQVLRGVHTTMLTACTSKGEHQIGETTLHIALHMEVG